MAVISNYEHLVLSIELIIGGKFLSLIKRPFMVCNRLWFGRAGNWTIVIGAERYTL